MLCCARMGNDGKCSTHVPQRTPSRSKAHDRAVPSHHTRICADSGLETLVRHRTEAARHAQANSWSTPAAKGAAWACVGITSTKVPPTPAYGSMHAHVGAMATSNGARLATAQPFLIAPQLRRPTPRRPLQVTNCLKCAAQQLQQLIKLPQSHHNSSSTARGQQVCMRHELSVACCRQAQHKHTDVAIDQCAMQIEHHQQQQDCQHAAWPPTLALAAAGWQTGPTNSSGSSSSRLAAGSTKRQSSASDSLPSPAAQQEAQRTQQQQQQLQASPDILEPHPQQQQQEASDAGATEGGGIDSPGVRAALAALKWYKGFLSPSMASTCRFLPTCSQYSMDSYRK